MERDFSSTYHKRLNKIQLQKQLENIKKRIKPSKSRWVSTTSTIFDVLKLMEIKSQMGVFQSFDPKDFGADYDIVPIPKDNSNDAEFWLGQINN